MSKRRRGPRWVDYCVYLLVRLAELVICVFPSRTNMRTARLFGYLWFNLLWRLPGLGRLREHRRRACDHLRQAFPEWSQEQVERVALASQQHFAMLAFEVLLTPRVIVPWRLARHIRLKNLAPALEVLLDNPAAILCTGHYGSWELLGYVLALLGFEIVAVMRPLDNEYLNRHLMVIREQAGLTLLYKKGMTATADDVLQSGRALGFIADQNAGRKGYFVDFFHRPASTYKSLALLAIEHRLPIIVGYARRLNDDFVYEIGVERIIRPCDWEHRPDAPLWITQTYTHAMEDFIRRDPTQYLWMHRRWKSQPRGERVESEAMEALEPAESGPAA
jgi:KDO2-lipid IV(A) lauroyltransferase